jgi:hypothetical protein
VPELIRQRRFSAGVELERFRQAVEGAGDGQPIATAGDQPHAWPRISSEGRAAFASIRLAAPLVAAPATGLISVTS